MEQNIEVLFEYQKFSPNSKLESKIKEIKSPDFRAHSERDE